MALIPVRVHFADSDYDYVTEVNGDVGKESIKQYFVGKWFNLGHYDFDDMQRCVGIEFDTD